MLTNMSRVEGGRRQDSWSYAGPSSFPPIADYAFLSDCETSCLIAPSGAVEWMCAPRPDSPSVFGAILDRTAGSFHLNPWGVRVPAARRYLPGSLIVETTWQSRTGWLIVRDAMTKGPWHNQESRSKTHRRPPTDAGGRVPAADRPGTARLKDDRTCAASCP